MNNEQLLQKILELETRIKVLENRELVIKDKTGNKLDWLNKNKEGKKFKEFYHSLKIDQDDIDYLFDNNFTNTISYILVKHIRQSDDIIVWGFETSKTIYI